MADFSLLKDAKAACFCEDGNVCLKQTATEMNSKRSRLVRVNTTYHTTRVGEDPD